MSEVRWGVLSTANIGRKVVVPSIVASSNGVLAAVASREGARGQAFAAEFGGVRAHASYEALLADPEVDALWERFGAHVKIAVVRDRKYLSWRLARPGGGYKLLAFRRAGELRGLAIIACKDKHGGKIGYLHLRGGAWDGTQLLPEGWVDYVRTPTPGRGSPT